MSGIIFILAFAAIGRGPPSPQTITSLEFNDMVLMEIGHDESHRRPIHPVPDD